ncbi:MAG: 1-acyl-sn-glycerol-3-phosphate acyltransferase [Bacteroidales bacterium]|nr:1-acyl-sn-glycerol-3-phosphate acyltransferase [Bacteroidales bacterium]
MGKFSRFLLRSWNLNDAPPMKKAIVVMAPHTSMIDFIQGKLFFSACDLKPKFLMKKELFWWPLGCLIRSLGGVPIDRKKRVGQIRQVVDAFNSNDNFILVMCPEGTRKKTKKWKRGFIKMAQSCEVPVFIGFIDYKTRSLGIKCELDMSGTDTEIVNRMKAIFAPMQGRNNDCFDASPEDEN